MKDCQLNLIGSALALLFGDNFVTKKRKWSQIKFVITNDDKESSKVNQSSHMKIQTHGKIEFSDFFFNTPGK